MFKIYTVSEVNRIRDSIWNHVDMKNAFSRRSF